MILQWFMALKNNLGLKGVVAVAISELVFNLIAMIASTSLHAVDPYYAIGIGTGLLSRIILSIIGT